MKKIFTLMAAAVMALAANAVEFTDKMTVDLGSGEPVVTPDAKIIVDEVENSDGLYNITLKDFSFGTINLGDIKMENVKGDDDTEGFTTFNEMTTTVNVDIYGTTIPATVTLNESSKMKDGKLYLNMSIQALTMNISAVFGDDNFPKSYTDQLTVTAMGSTMPSQEATIIVTKQDDGNYTLSLKNFTLEGVMAVGTVEMKDVAAVEEDGKVKLTTKQTVTIQDGDDPDVTWALSGVPVDVDMTAEMTDSKLTATINILYSIPGVFDMDIEVAFGYVPSGISNVTVSDNGVETIYDLSGKKLNELQKGINIVRKADGTTVKVLKK